MRVGTEFKIFYMEECYTWVSNIFHHNTFIIQSLSHDDIKIQYNQLTKEKKKKNFLSNKNATNHLNIAQIR